MPSLRSVRRDRLGRVGDDAESIEHSTGSRTLSRRRFLASGATTASVGFAGCAESIGNFIAEFVLDDVNLLNETDRNLAGSIVVTDPSGETILDAAFDLEPAADEADESNEDSQAVYSDLFETDGEHVFTVELADDEIDGETGAALTGEIADPEEEHAVVVMGSDELMAPFELFVIEAFTDLGEHIDDAAVDD